MVIPLPGVTGDQLHENLLAVLRVQDSFCDKNPSLHRSISAILAAPDT
jgi:hypothetical protein